jgi:putative glutamine amidotransferase
METRLFYLGRDYCEALQHFGAIPFHIGLIPDKKYISEALKNLDGILLPGSDTDIDPFYFGEEPHTKLKKVIPEKDQTDFMILDYAEEFNIPILAICFGSQALNVHRGGTLIQDIEMQVENSLRHEQGKPLERNSHSLIFERESKLAGLITPEDVNNNLRVNSHHHQSIKNVGKNLRATAWAKDSVIECIEDTRNDRFVIGVQWHPELSWKTNNLSKNIFKAFVEECRKYAESNKRKTCEETSTTAS